MNNVECLNDIGRLLSDVHHCESVSLRKLLALNINKDLKDILTQTPIEQWFSGTDLDSTIKTTKDLEKSSEQLRFRVQKGQCGGSRRTFKQRKQVYS